MGAWRTDAGTRSPVERFAGTLCELLPVPPPPRPVHGQWAAAESLFC